VYGDQVRIVWKHFPLDMHKDAPLAHLASEAAKEQGKFWEYYEKVFANQRQIKRDDLIRYAREIGLDVQRFEQALDQQRGQARIDADIAEIKQIGVTGTPGFFINGRYLSGAKPFEEFAKMINAELTKLGRPVPPGAQG